MQMPAPHILATIGRTPLVALQRLYADWPVRLFGKIEGLNPGGSIKDRTATLILTDALQRGQLRPGDHVIESSSGNMAIGLAQACRYLGLQLTVVVDPNTPPQTCALLAAYGATVDRIRPQPGAGTFLAQRLARVQALCAATPRSFWPNQYANPLNPQAHHETMAEIVAQLPAPPDYLLAAASTCGTLMGCAQYIQAQGLPTQVVAVDAVGSVLFGDAPGPRHIPGHGAGCPAPLLDRALVDHHRHVDDVASVWGCHRLLDREAILAGGSSGAVVAGLAQLLPTLPAGATCVLILCDRGERYLDTIYTPDWVAETLGLALSDIQALPAPELLYA